MKNKNIITKIGIVAPASPFKKEAFDHGNKFVSSLGAKTQFTNKIFKKTGFTVGDPKQRAIDLLEMIGNKDIEAVFFARGGYGCSQILPLLDKHDLSKKLKNKVFMGNSDITAIFCYLYSKYETPCLYGPNVTSPYFKNKQLLKKVLNMKHGTKQKIKILRAEKTKITAPVFGGCLSVMASLAGTPYMKKLDGHILFIEDTNEAPYKIDRMLTQLVQAGIIKNIKAIAVGAMKKCDSPSISWKEPVLRIAKELNIPVVYGIRAGHAGFDTVIKLGAKATIDFNKKEFEIKD